MVTYVKHYKRERRVELQLDQTIYSMEIFDSFPRHPISFSFSSVVYYQYSSK